MVDFACKTVELDEVVKCSLNLTKADLRVLKYLLDCDKEYLTADLLSKSLGFDLSTIQKSVKKLHERGVVTRSQNNLDSGGYVFVYKIKPKNDIKETIMFSVTAWVELLEEELGKWASK
ncbi:MarR family transcriptional regulator [Methanosalsum natronophilum]|uniref:MarR family transcriptional regulator n=1 Tax=Methanosalsum natronophilum TaxID=768733 RepID=A0A424YYJ0_9EURY|nr:MAG: MarR family transcriptional regulator [Methanosalsum natronophilum]